MNMNNTKDKFESFSMETQKNGSTVQGSIPKPWHMRLFKEHDLRCGALAKSGHGFCDIPKSECSIRCVQVTTRCMMREWKRCIGRKKCVCEILEYRLFCVPQCRAVEHMACYRVQCSGAKLASVIGTVVVVSRNSV